VAGEILYLAIEKNGIEGVTGILEYPKLRETTKVTLTDEDMVYLENLIVEIEQITSSDNCPPEVETKICKSCSYYEFCNVREGE
jgi:CRISPR-associated exonuclease Cas4